MMMGSDEGSTTTMDGFFSMDDDSNDVYIDIDLFTGEFGSPFTDFQDSRLDEPPPCNILNESFTAVGDGTSQGASHIGSASREFALEDVPHTSFGNDDMQYVPLTSEIQPYISSSMEELMQFMAPGEDLFHSKVEQQGANCENGSTIPIQSRFDVSQYSGDSAAQINLRKSHSYTWSNGFHILQHEMNVNDSNESVSSPDVVSRAFEVVDDIISRKNCGGVAELSATGEIEWSSANSQSLVSGLDFVPCAVVEKDESFQSRKTYQSLCMSNESPMEYYDQFAHDHCLPDSEQPDIHSSYSVKAESKCPMVENEVPDMNGSFTKNICYQTIPCNTFDQSIAEDDSDLCILEDLSTPVYPNRQMLNAKSTASFQTSTYPDMKKAITQSRPRPNDERVIFRVAIEDLSQPKSEATLPDGVLSVPLLKHQRIALSWMVHKETKSACCAGGILADDQGLGKTISTIALILKERSPSKINEHKSKSEMLSLDEDDEISPETRHLTGVTPCNVNGRLMIGGRISSQSNGRPSGGTLIVCPTSVLRQWSDELHNKVTREANLSVLIYHGNNRAKDPLELAKYDVVITTYAIVSMEVPKQPVVNESDDQISSSCKGISTCTKRKLAYTSGKKSTPGKKSKKGIDDESIENLSCALAKVVWFRVVLDEAQSIKNHRTQVARACWGLRAKRRWCLSGTPIQNAIDDLYSYFRFLRHEPYAVFRVFCDQIKLPIQKNPRNGYKKLQAVLKTVMLRRTKGTLLDGEPIINIPPKTIELRKIDFSDDERDFYSRLESESRAQFAEYAAAGTVKENYVNILLMLLRLRQACDHPLLVRGFNSSSNTTSSIEVAKTLSREKLNCLLKCLEASLAICGICRDAPEDAVVTVCGHVFCNPCISEHIIGDETQCPAKKCRTNLTKSSVFSIDTLKVALSDQLNTENTSNISHSDVSQLHEPHSLTCPEDSSKIRAAFNLLMALTQPKNRSSGSSLLDHSDGTEQFALCGPGGSSVASTDLKNCDKVPGEKAIVFSQWTGMLDLLEACLKKSPIQYRRLDGTMHVAARDRAVKDFNNLPQVSVMIMSLKAASLGLNMVAACNVLLLDLWWNPTTEDQAIDRAHRIGQTRPVSVFRLTIKDTVEDRILALQGRKRKMVASAFGENEAGGDRARLTVEDLKYLFNVTKKL